MAPFQIATSSNVGGSLLCHLNGGLNYQIEHHLFPRVNHCHYPLIAPVVRQAEVDISELGIRLESLMLILAKNLKGSCHSLISCK